MKQKNATPDHNPIDTHFFNILGPAYIMSFVLHKYRIALDAKWSKPDNKLCKLNNRCLTLVTYFSTMRILVVLSISFYNRFCHLFQRLWYSACTKSTVFFRTITPMLYVQTFQFCVIKKRWRCAFRLRYLSHFSWHL